MFVSRSSMLLKGLTAFAVVATLSLSGPTLSGEQTKNYYRYEICSCGNRCTTEACPRGQACCTEPS